MGINDDKRRFPRIPFEGEAVIYAASRRLICPTVNLSAGGILVLPPARSTPGLVVRVSFGFPKRNRSFALGGVLVRETTHSEQYAWGIRFSGVPSRIEPILDEFIHDELLRTCQLPSEAELEGIAKELLGASPAGSSIGAARPAAPPVGVRRHGSWAVEGEEESLSAQEAAAVEREFGSLDRLADAPEDVVADRKEIERTFERELQALFHKSLANIKKEDLP